MRSEMARLSFGQDRFRAIYQAMQDPETDQEVMRRWVTTWKRAGEELDRAALRLQEEKRDGFNARVAKSGSLRRWLRVPDFRFVSHAILIDHQRPT
jgi:hypothetical protein